MLIRSAKDFGVYKLAYKLAIEILRISKSFPKEVTYTLTDQIRRSSRSVCAHLREAWAKRRYEAQLVSKLTDVDSEASETDTWLIFHEMPSTLTNKNLSNKCRHGDSIAR